MKKILKVNGPRGVIPSVYFKTDGSPLQNESISTYLCDEVEDISQKNDLIVYMTAKEFDIAKKSLEACTSS